AAGGRRPAAAADAAAAHVPPRAAAVVLVPPVRQAAHPARDQPARLPGEHNAPRGAGCAADPAERERARGPAVHHDRVQPAGLPPRGLRRLLPGLHRRARPVARGGGHGRARDPPAGPLRAHGAGAGALRDRAAHRHPAARRAGRPHQQRRPAAVPDGVHGLRARLHGPGPDLPRHAAGRAEPHAGGGQPGGGRGLRARDALRGAGRAAALGGGGLRARPSGRAALPPHGRGGGGGDCRGRDGARGGGAGRGRAAGVGGRCGDGRPPGGRAARLGAPRGGGGGGRPARDGRGRGAAPAVQRRARQPAPVDGGVPAGPHAAGGARRARDGGGVRRGQRGHRRQDHAGGRRLRRLHPRAGGALLHRPPADGAHRRHGGAAHAGLPVPHHPAPRQRRRPRRRRRPERHGGRSAGGAPDPDGVRVGGGRWAGQGRLPADPRHADQTWRAPPPALMARVAAGTRPSSAWATPPPGGLTLDQVREAVTARLTTDRWACPSAGRGPGRAGGPRAQVPRHRARSQRQVEAPTLAVPPCGGAGAESRTWTQVPAGSDERLRFTSAGTASTGWATCRTARTLLDLFRHRVSGGAWFAGTTRRQRAPRLLREVVNRRLFSNVREQKRLTYDANFHLTAFENLAGSWYLVTVTANPVNAQRALQACKDTPTTSRGQPHHP
ncbi:unnamed protein product, partial [Heterosigma akashiwo]